MQKWIAVLKNTNKACTKISKNLESNNSIGKRMKMATTTLKEHIGSMEAIPPLEKAVRNASLSPAGSAWKQTLPQYATPIHKIKYVLLFLGLTMIISPLYSQKQQTHDVVLGSLQIKEELNLGMVFSGVQLEYRYGIQWTIKNHEIGYQPQLGFGVGFCRLSGMEGYQLHVAPMNVTWRMLFYEKNGHAVKGGVNFLTDYNYQLYEKLHDAPLFWNSEIGFSLAFRYSFQWSNQKICVSLRNSLFGFTSHFQGYDPYFWQKTWKDYFVKPHTNLKFGSFNHYNHTIVSLEFVPNTEKKHSIGYEFDYLGLFYGNKLHRINHYLIWRISL
jgi:hypothetical protein